MGVSSVVGTFVFSVYLTRGVGDDLPGGTSPASWLGRALAIAGLLVALLAPVIGVWVDAPWRRRRVLALLTGAVVLTTADIGLCIPLELTAVTANTVSSEPGMITAVLTGLMVPVLVTRGPPKRTSALISADQ